MSQESTGCSMLFILPHLREQQMGIIVIRLVLPCRSFVVVSECKLHRNAVCIDIDTWYDTLPLCLGIATGILV